MPEEDGLDCDCAKGWKGLPELEPDGQHWPLGFAAELLCIPERDLRNLVRKAGLEPSGTMRISAYRRSGRHPRAYEAARLIRLVEENRKA